MNEMMPERVTISDDIDGALRVTDGAPRICNNEANYIRADLADELAGALVDLWNRVSNDTDFEEIAFSLDRARDVIERYKKLQEGE